MYVRLQPIFLSVAVLIAMPGVVSANDEQLLEEAERAIQLGDLPEAERIYDQILARSPGELDTRVKRGIVRSWQERHREAQSDFRTVLESEPTHLGALVGLGYDLAWDGAYREAAATFRRALSVEPDNSDARKGIAYTYLWSGETSLGLDVFESLRRSHQEDAETAVAVGQAHLAMGHHRRARAAFREALTLEPSRVDAKEGIAAVRDLGAPLETSFWFGNTTGGGGSGLRQVEISSWVHRAIRLSARYDNSLSLDNPALARTGQESEAFLGGILSDWGGSFLTRVEAGRRELADGVTQTLILPEVTYLRHGFFLKGGGVIAPSSNDTTDRTGYVGFGFPLSKRCRLEPTVYLSEYGITKDQEWRTNVYGECRGLGGWTVGFGGGGGRIDAAIDDASGRLWTGLFHLSIPLGGFHRLFVTVRHEDSPLNAYTVSMLGVALRLPRN